MKKVFLLILSLGLVTAPIHVQAGWKVFPRVKTSITAIGKNTRRFNPLLVSRRLTKRVATSYQQAQKAQLALGENARRIQMGEPIRRIRSTKDMPQTEVYADKPFLTTRKQTANYMIAKSNRLFLREIERLKRLWNTLDERLPQLQEAAQQTPQVERPIEWLAQQIPDKTTTLFVGEAHGFAEITETVDRLLALLVQRNPRQQIILFTEFLPQDFHYTANTPREALHLKKFERLWKRAIKRNIQVIGLEPMHVMEDHCRVELLSRENSKMVTGLQWAHLEGMRLRNEVWTHTLEKYREQYPDALFVVYTGAAHSLYNYAFSLSKALTKETSFVTALYPREYFKMEVEHGWFSSSLTAQLVPFPDPLDRMTHEGAFPQAIVQFTDPELAQLAGFDVRLKLRVNTFRLAQENGLLW